MVVGLCFPADDHDRRKKSALLSARASSGTKSCAKPVPRLASFFFSLSADFAFRARRLPTRQAAMVLIDRMHTSDSQMSTPETSGSLFQTVADVLPLAIEAFLSAAIYLPLDYFGPQPHMPWASKQQEESTAPTTPCLLPAQDGHRRESEPRPIEVMESVSCLFVFSVF